MLKDKIPVIAAFSSDGSVIPLYAKVLCQDGYEVVHFIKVDKINDDVCNDKDFPKFRCRYLLDGTGVSREIKICLSKRESTWYIVN